MFLVFFSSPSSPVSISTKCCLSFVFHLCWRDHPYHSAIFVFLCGAEMKPKTSHMLSRSGTLPLSYTPIPRSWPPPRASSPSILMCHCPQNCWTRGWTLGRGNGGPGCWRHTHFHQRLSGFSCNQRTVCLQLQIGNGNCPHGGVE